jgi:hypothetical protein
VSAVGAAILMLGYEERVRWTAARFEEEAFKELDDRNAHAFVAIESVVGTTVEEGCATVLGR